MAGFEGRHDQVRIQDMYVYHGLTSPMSRCGQPVVTYVMNPKSMHRERLLGHMDMDTREWADGVLTDAARKVVLESPEVRCWIICDGDVDPEVRLYFFR
jgi:dynein heavy chain 2